MFKFVKASLTIRYANIFVYFVAIYNTGCVIILVQRYIGDRMGGKNGSNFELSYLVTYFDCIFWWNKRGKVVLFKRQEVEVSNHLQGVKLF